MTHYEKDIANQILQKISSNYEGEKPHQLCVAALFVQMYLL